MRWSPVFGLQSFFERRVDFLVLFCGAQQPVDKSKAVDLVKLRSIPCSQLLPRLCDHAKLDRDFVPLKNGHTERWHVNTGGHDFQILVTGTKFFDARAGKGGGGAIDLAMHLFSIDFKSALTMLVAMELHKQTQRSINMSHSVGVASIAAIKRSRAK